MWEHENSADNVQKKQTDELQWMMLQMSHAKQSHKSIAHIHHTNQLHKIG